MEKEIIRFKCAKCGNLEYEISQMRVATGFWDKIFNIQSLRFKTVSCSNCWYTEIYKDTKKRTAENVLDFFAN